MKKIENTQRMMKSALCGLCLILTGCGAASLAQEASFESAYENSEKEEPVNIYTSLATVVVEGVDEENRVLSLYMIDRNENRTLTYDGTTLVQDKYGSPMAMAQLQAGDIAEITYNDELERAGSITLSGDAWSYEEIAKYELNASNASVNIGDESYNIAGNVLAFSNGKQIRVDQIIHQDILSFQGKGHSVMSITIDRGHGYLELKNDEAVLGGWIEVGQAVISQIAPDMLITVPEGTYTVRLTGDGIDESREVTISRDQVTELDLGDIEIPEPENGIVIFEVTPANAKVYVDDAAVKAAYPVRVPLGLHRVTAEASGYDSLSEYIQVDGEKLTVQMDLQEQSTVSGNTFSEPQEQNRGNVTIEAPAGAEVYQDNLYMGIAPVTYEKTPGDHTITLRRAGYITRSYDIVVADDDKDVTYAFPELEPEDTSSTVSGNNAGDKSGSSSGTVSGNTINNNYYYNTVNNNTNGNAQDNNQGNADDTVSGNSVSDNSLQPEA